MTVVVNELRCFLPNNFAKDHKSSIFTTIAVLQDLVKQKEMVVEKYALFSFIIIFSPILLNLHINSLFKDLLVSYIHVMFLCQFCTFWVYLC